jgi:hypothetical protein
MDEIILKCSNDHLEHTGSIGYGGSAESLASVHELSDDSNGYTTPPSDFADEIMYDDGVIQMDGADELATVWLFSLILLSRQLLQHFFR